MYTGFESIEESHDMSMFIDFEVCCPFCDSNALFVQPSDNTTSYSCLACGNSWDVVRDGLL